MAKSSSKTDAICLAICERLANGESLRSICLDKGMPSPGTVCRWLAEDEAFAEQYTRAREAQAETLADEIVAIADEEAEDSQRQRLRVDARKWVAAKLKPKKYGDKVELEHNGNLTVNVVGCA